MIISGAYQLYRLFDLLEEILTTPKLMPKYQISNVRRYIPNNKKLDKQDKKAGYEALEFNLSKLNSVGSIGRIELWYMHRDPKLCISFDSTQPIFGNLKQKENITEEYFFTNIESGSNRSFYFTASNTLIDELEESNSQESKKLLKTFICNSLLQI